jgi:hypothetical protein
MRLSQCLNPAVSLHLKSILQFMANHEYRKSLHDSTLSQVVSSIRNRGIKRTLEIILSLPGNYFFDIKYGTDTARNQALNSLEVVGTNKSRATWAESTQQRPFRKLIQQLRLPCKGDFVDLGSGKGKVLLLASEYTFSSVVGVEFAEELCWISRGNISRYTQKVQLKSEIKVITSDVVDYRFSGREEVIYIANPFDGFILGRVLENIIESLNSNDRPLWIIYNTAVHRSVLDNCPYFETALETSLGMHDFVVFHHPEKS